MDIVAVRDRSFQFIRVGVFYIEIDLDGVPNGPVFIVNDSLHTGVPIDQLSDTSTDGIPVYFQSGQAVGVLAVGSVDVDGGAQRFGGSAKYF